MTRPAQLLVVCWVMFACTHVDEVPDARETNAKPAARAPVKKAVSAPVTTAGDEKAAPGRPELSTTPAGLMKPGAVEKIQDALRGRGLLQEPTNGRLDDATTHALMAFQKTEELARTGAPDRETLRHLGLKPKEIYKDGDR
jgi:hypothetical protein